MPRLRQPPIINPIMKPCVLLHICCAPDSTATFEQLAPDYEVVGFFHNDNLFPPEEYALRLANAEKAAAALGFTLEPCDYQPAAWDEAVRGLESEPEKGRRCAACFRYNLTAAALRAQALGIPHFTTTLTISPHKSSALIFEIGNEIGRTTGVEFLEIDFKKKGGFQRSLEMTRELGLYRQNYCGCKYSLRSADARIA